MRSRLLAVVLLALALPASAPVSAGLAHVQLFDGRGKPRGGVSVRAGRTPSELLVALPPLPKGAYRIAWSTVSQDDLHATRGAVVFGAGTVAPPARASDSPTAGTSIT